VEARFQGLANKSTFLPNVLFWFKPGKALRESDVNRRLNKGSFLLSAQVSCLCQQLGTQSTTVPAANDLCNTDNQVMRTDLVTPFAEKDAAKALGARWDAKSKNWYIVDVADLTPFLRWIPNLGATPKALDDGKIQPAAQTMLKPKSAMMPRSGKSVDVLHCGCNVLPWEDCIHTARL